MLPPVGGPPDDPPRRGLGDAEEHLAQRRLAGPALPHDAEILAPAQVQVHAAELGRTGCGQDTAREVNGAAELRQDRAPVIAALGGVGGPIRDAHGAAGDHGRGQERAGVGEVRFHGDVQPGHPSGFDPPFGVTDARGVHTGLAQHLHGHGHVGQGRDPGAVGLVFEHQRAIEAHGSQHEGGDEL